MNSPLLFSACLSTLFLYSVRSRSLPGMLLSFPRNHNCVRDHAFLLFLSHVSRLVLSPLFFLWLYFRQWCTKATQDLVSKSLYMHTILTKLEELIQQMVRKPGTKTRKTTTKNKGAYQRRGRDVKMCKLAFSGCMEQLRFASAGTKATWLTGRSAFSRAA